MKATVAPMPAKAERIPTAKNPIGEAPLSLSAVPLTTTSLDLVSTSSSSSLDSVEAEGDGEEVTLGEDDADGVDADGVDADGVDADGVVVSGVKVRFRLRLKLYPSPNPPLSPDDMLKEKLQSY